MKILWRIQKGFIKEIIAEMPKPQPPYTSVSTIVRKLQERGIIGHDAFGKTHRYYPILSQEEYRNQSFSKLFKEYFNGSYEKMVSYFLQENRDNIEELEKLLKDIKKKRK